MLIYVIDDEEAVLEYTTEVVTEAIGQSEVEIKRFLRGT